MEKIEYDPRLIDEARNTDKLMQAKIDAGDADNFREAQELVAIDEAFEIDDKRDIEDIKRLMRRVRKDLEREKLGSEYGYNDDKRLERLKYSDEQVEAEQWEEEDFKFVVQELRKERIDTYFSEIARKYEQALPIPDSVVRTDQEAEIAEALRADTPVLIRGNWRVGKTSMVRSLETHRFGADNSIYIDVMSENIHQSVEDFRMHFGTYAVAQFIAIKELAGSESTEIMEKDDQIMDQIESSRQSPINFLNDYLKRKGEKVFLSLDEVIGFAKEPEKMKYLAGLKDLSQIQLAIVLHRYASFENSFHEIFSGYETNFVRPLTIEEVGLLVRRPLEGTQITFTDDAILRIYEFTGGRPMEINNICQALMDQYSEHKIYRFTYTAADIDKLIEKEIWKFKDTFMVAIETYRRVYNRSMSDQERAIIDRLIDEDEVSVSEINADIVQPLIDTTFVTINEDKGVYRINGVLFKRVILEQRR